MSFAQTIKLQVLDPDDIQLTNSELAKLIEQAKLAQDKLRSIAVSIRENANRVSDYTHAVVDGDLSQTLNQHSSDSLGEIGEYLNQTVEQLNQKMQRICQANRH
ncbi:hypothetical protein HR060_07425 [Catenovulum sp. SM1970]|uniref:HAMP domain-containing protein n=1 Tax=Marinifaba aquimaris TaxID=2741323 RepID=UPI0015723FA3|nr:HAMP domain-containing protein [Marinifaba aquimaris]NTS76697.1 hypothetical protein [Marinifaba aquimaris]